MQSVAMGQMEDACLMSLRILEGKRLTLHVDVDIFVLKTRTVSLAIPVIAQQVQRVYVCLQTVPQGAIVRRRPVGYPLIILAVK